MLGMNTTLKDRCERGSKTRFKVAEIKDVLTVNISSAENHLYHECCIRKTTIYFRPEKSLKPTSTFTGQRARAACLLLQCRASSFLPARAYLSPRKLLTVSLSPGSSTSHPLRLFLANVVRAKAALFGVRPTRNDI